jgi:hypothetical protein
MSKTESEGLLIGNNSIYQVDEKAVNFLRSQDYNFTRARLYLLFPTLYYFNLLKPDQTLELSEEEMEKKMENYLK